MVVDPAERDRIVESLHADPVGGSHYGQTATIRKVTNRFWWRSVAADTREFVRGCPACQNENVCVPYGVWYSDMSKICGDVMFVAFD